jgi:SAM-dependent methyltransferase
MVSLYECGAFESFETVGEIGSGDSMATGLATLLSGANRYVGLDIVPTAHNFDNKEIFDELVDMFRRKEPIPDEVEQPKQRPHLSSYAFPSHILTDEKLAILLSEERIRRIRAAVDDAQKKVPSGVSSIIEYEVPWDTFAAIRRHESAFDLVFSSAVLEHVEDVSRTYACAARILKKGGIFVSVIDYKAHDTAGPWNGHWTYSDVVWRIIRGRCAYLINRWTHSMHLRELAKHFVIVREIPYYRDSELALSDISSRFAGLPAVDFKTCEGFIVARKSPLVS